MFGRTIKCSIAKDNGRAAEFIRRRDYPDKSRCYECGVSCEPAPGSPLTDIIFNDGGEGKGLGGFDRGSYFIPQKIPTSDLSTPKKSLLFLPYTKKSLRVFASAHFINYLPET